MTNRISDKNTIVIFTAKLARNLLKNGFTIVDIKPDRDIPLDIVYEDNTDEDNKRSVFIFKNENHIEDKIKEYNSRWT